MRVADNDVVEDFDFEELSGAYQVACNLYVGFRWRRFPAWVVVREDNGGGIGHNGQPEYFTGRNENGIQRADSRNFDTSFMVKITA